MVSTSRKTQILTHRLNSLSINQQVQMVDPVMNYVLSPLEWKINPEYL